MKNIINYYIHYILDLIECKQFIEEVAKKKTTSAEVAPNIYGGHR